MDPELRSGPQRFKVVYFSVYMIRKTKLQARFYLTPDYFSWSLATRSENGTHQGKARLDETKTERG